ncbi:MAG: FAD-dependent oxidoreductase [Thermodesulfobacteriota bacterium]|nr:FAD-dependent oxidoreductase [Thermodesulfobacteriota bacterium]
MATEKSDVVVLGGSAAGLTAAITAHRQYPEKSVVIIRKEAKVLIPCGIPYIFGTVGTPEKNLVPDAVLDKNKIKLIVGEAEKIDTENKTVKLAGGDEVVYEKLIVATGSLPAMPPIPGFDKENVWAIHKDVELLRGIQGKLKDVKDLVIVGGGFIGIEFADECKKAGVENVSIVELLPHCLMLAFDEEFAVEAEKVLIERGIKLVTGVKVLEFAGGKKVESVKLGNGEELKADAVIMGIGAVANVKMAKKSGLKLGPTGAIEVNRYLAASDPDVFACGDCAEKVSFFGGRSSPLKLASIAASEARIAGANLFGLRRENIGTIGVWGTAIGDFALSCAGLTESMAKEAGYDFVIGEAEGPNRHPGTMPGAENVKVKLTFERRTGVLLGAQMMGGSVVGELINVMSACIQKKMTIDDIAVFQIGTHPALTASPIAYQVVNAAEMAFMKTKK